MNPVPDTSPLGACAADSTRPAAPIHTPVGGRTNQTQPLYNGSTIMLQTIVTFIAISPNCYPLLVFGGRGFHMIVG